MSVPRICAIIPTYNNATTLLQVIADVLQYITAVIVVDDGSTDQANELVQQTHLGGVTLISYQPNRGKAHALKMGFQEAHRLGYTHALTIDSDGQHDTASIPDVVQAAIDHPDALIVGVRDFDNQPDMPRGNAAANRFSNFWFTVQTGVRLADTQTGFRLYPLNHLHWLPLVPNRYEGELALLVYAAWHGVDLLAVPVGVHYPPREQRVTHFRPVTDFARISLLNTALCLGALCYGWPRRLLRTIGL